MLMLESCSFTQLSHWVELTYFKWIQYEIMECMKYSLSCDENFGLFGHVNKQKPELIKFW